MNEPSHARSLSWAAWLIIALGACDGSPTEVALSLQSTRPVTLSRLAIFVSLDGAAEVDPLDLSPGAVTLILPGALLLRVPDDARTVTVRATAVSTEGIPRSAMDTVLTLAGRRVELPLRLLFDPAGGGAALQLGEACVVAADCDSGYCVDGVCCDTTCDDDACIACTTARGGEIDGLCGVRALGSECRASVGECDLAESCDGHARGCPADLHAAAATPCRPLTGACDLAEVCDGTSVACPFDASLCDQASYCDGNACAPRKPTGSSCANDKECSSAFCTEGLCCDTRCEGGTCASCATAAAPGVCTLLPSTVTCRPAAGSCDVAEKCSGSSAACPFDGFAAATVQCRAAVPGVCDVAELCTGANAQCPQLDKFAPMGTLCRAVGADPCDRAEVCTGTAATCPSDTAAPHVTSTFSSSATGDGTLRDDGAKDTSSVRPSCNGYHDNRGFVSVDTSALPDTATILNVSARACLAYKSGSTAAQLYSATYTLPLAGGSYNAPGIYLRDIPDPGISLPGWFNFTLPVTAVSKTAPSQFMMRYPFSGCAPSEQAREYTGAASTPASYPDCPLEGTETTIGWRLTVEHCTP